ncbi:hypothetical protein PO909_013370, partial [Leuciscus waleckii]
GSHGKLPRPEDSYVFEEDSSSESLSPESLSENKTSPTHTSTEHGPQSKDGSAQTPEENMSDGQGTTPIPVQAMVKQSKVSEKNRHKKPKDIKPKVKKLKYHQYIPPDQKAERSPPAQMDSAYARLLQQQQLFLQLQILSQQKHTHSQTHSQTSFSYQINQHKSSGEQQASCASAGSSSSSSSPVKSNYCSPSSINSINSINSLNSISPAPLPNNLDDLKVSELRQQLRIRGLPVSGTKTSLIERLRPFKDSSCASPSGSGDVSTGPFPVTPSGSSYQSPASHGPGFYPFCSSGSSPPISPASSDLSLPDSFSDGTLSSPPLGPDAEKDKMLVEKQKVIEELRWKLQQEQRQVEELRFELHKRSRECPVIMEPPVQVQQGYGVSVKQEHVSSSCPLSSEQGNGVCVGHCDPSLSAFMSPQCSPQESPVTKPSSSPQPESPVQPFLLRDSHRPARNMQLQQKSVCQSSCSYPSDHRSLQSLYTSPENSMNPRGSSKNKSANLQQKEARSHSPRHLEPQSPTSSSVFCSSDCPVSLSKPPCYEEAVKQMVRSQQMDELLDVLIESGVSPKFQHRHYSHMCAYEPGDGHLEALLSRTHTDTHSDTHSDETGEGFNDRLIMDTPVIGKMETQGLGMTFTDSPWETMEWLDLTPPNSFQNQNALPLTGPNIFNTEFLDVTDISLNSAMDLHLDHW